MAHPRLDLADWKRRVLAMYARVREAGGDPDACEAFRTARDGLLREHPQSPLPAEERAGFAGIPYFAHRPEMRVEAELAPDDAGAELIIPTSTGEPTRFTRIGSVRPTLGGREVSLAVLLVEGYGGGLFLPFRDALAGTEPTGAAATCSTPSRARTWAAAAAGGSCSTSTTPTTRPAPTTRAGAARWRRRRTASTWRSRPASGRRARAEGGPMTTATRPVTGPDTPPGPGRRGSLALIGERRRDPLGMFVRLRREYGPVVAFRMGPLDMYLVTEPDLVQEVFTTHAARVRKGRILEGARVLLGDGLLTSEGEHHRRQRRLIQPAFHHARLGATPGSCPAAPTRPPPAGPTARSSTSSAR